MGKKLLKPSTPSLFHHPQQFLAFCKQPKTLSFRCGDEIFRTVNSVFFDPIENSNTFPEFTNSTETAESFSTDSDEDFCFDGESLERVVREARSERLFFEPRGDTRSILEKAKTRGFPIKESVILAMESEDPYEDFKRSMEEMVESHGVKDWNDLEELLSWYLWVNGKKNHGFIVEAFVDLLVTLAANNHDMSCTNNSTSYSSAVSSFGSSPNSCSFEGQSDIEEEKHTLPC